MFSRARHRRPAAGGSAIITKMPNRGVIQRIARILARGSLVGGHRLPSVLRAESPAPVEPRRPLVSKTRDNRLLVLAVAVGVVGVALVGIVLFALRLAVVPDVTLKSVAEATALVEQVGLTLGHARQDQRTAAVGPGLVAEPSPARESGTAPLVSGGDRGGRISDVAGTGRGRAPGCGGPAAADGRPVPPAKRRHLRNDDSARRRDRPGALGRNQLDDRSIGRDRRCRGSGRRDGCPGARSDGRVARGGHGDAGQGRARGNRLSWSTSRHRMPTS